MTSVGMHWIQLQLDQDFPNHNHLSHVRIPVSFTSNIPLNLNLSRLRLCWKLVTLCNDKVFVKPSSTWSLVEINLMSSCFRATRSCTKWQSTSMCFVHAWKTKFADRYVAPKLSHHNAAAGGWDIPSSSSKVWIHMISAVALGIALYHAFVLDRETVGNFLALQDTRFESRKRANPPVDLQSSRQSVQSASEKLDTSTDKDFVIFIRRSMVPLTNHKILLIVVRCSVVGECRYWQTLLSENVKLGCVRVKYYNLPTML
jgi:hypothetical protein